MRDGEVPKVDFDELMGRIRAEVERRRPPRLEPDPAKAPHPEPADEASPAALSPPDLSQLEAGVWAAEQVAEVGAQLPPMHRQRGVRRSLATLVARGFLRTAELITRDQRTFNRAALDSIRALGRALLEQNRQVSQVVGHPGVLAGQVRALAAEVEALRGKVEALEAEREARAGAAADARAHLLDAMYLEFEDIYRGTRQTIKQRARDYLLQPVREAGAGTPQRPVLDLGCGRGEWLELMADEGLVGRGVDTNRVFLQQCRDRKLEVVEADAVAHLRSLPEGSIGAVTAIHLVEHLPFEVLVELLTETVRVLAPGGVAVFETPNPNNLMVGARDFHRDPTHRNPLHPDTLQFLAQRRGLVRVSVLPLHPAPVEEHLPEDGSPLVRRLNEYFYGPRDFAILGYRPG